MGWSRYSGFAPYVRVADRKKQAEAKVAKLKKNGQVIQPIIIQGKTIAHTFWGKAWCSHLESYSDFENRLPRGRSYVRNGSVIDLQIHPGEIKALVNGSSLYTIHISISAFAQKKWKTLVTECSGKIDSLIELLMGKFSKGVMEVMTDTQKGLFPSPKEIKLSCSCPDWADMCKHVAAVLYGIGARFDEHPEELFLLRQVKHTDLITNIQSTSLVKSGSNNSEILADSDLSALFGIDIEKPVLQQKEKRVKKSVSKTKNSKIKKSSTPKRTKTHKEYPF